MLIRLPLELPPPPRKRPDRWLPMVGLGRGVRGCVRVVVVVTVVRRKPEPWLTVIGGGLTVVGVLGLYALIWWLN